MLPLLLMCQCCVRFKKKIYIYMFDHSCNFYVVLSENVSTWNKTIWYYFSLFSIPWKQLSVLVFLWGQFKSTFIINNNHNRFLEEGVSSSLPIQGFVPLFRHGESDSILPHNPTSDSMQSLTYRYLNKRYHCLV